MLFISITFQLNCDVNRKLGLLALGNFVGFGWNFIFNNVALEGALFFGKPFLVLYVFFFPFINSLWLISYWSLSLTALNYETVNGKRAL